MPGLAVPRWRRGRGALQTLRDPFVALSLLVVGVCLVIGIFYPLGQMLLEGFKGRSGDFDLATYDRVLNRPIFRGIIANTLLLGVLASVLSVLLGFYIAYVVVRVPLGRLGPVIRTLALLPIISPPFAVAMSTILLFGRSGLISKGVFGIENNIYGLQGLTLVQVVTFFPVPFLLFEGLLKALDASLEEAALNMGASRFHIFRTVTLPLMIPGFAGAGLLVFLESLADLGNPIVIGGDFNVLASQAWVSIIGQSNFPLGAALSTVLLVPSLLAFVLQRYWVSRRSYIAVTGKPTGGRVHYGSPWARIALTVPCVLIALFVALLYGALFMGAVTRVWGADYTLTFEHVSSGVGRAWGAILDTTLLSTIATPITGLIGMLVAVLVVRRNVPGQGLLDFSSMLGGAVPGTVLGIGYVLAFNRPPLLLTGTAAILVLVFVVRALPTGIRAGVAALQQIDPSIEEASANLGANGVATFRRITLPLINQALLAGMIFAFTRNMTQISAIIFLVSPRWKLLTKEILDLAELGYLGDAIALITILVAIVLVAIGVLYVAVGQWMRRDGREVVALQVGG
jgi:iron(III) transport system permease protein